MRQFWHFLGAWNLKKFIFSSKFYIFQQEELQVLLDEGRKEFNSSLPSFRSIFWTYTMQKRIKDKKYEGLEKKFDESLFMFFGISFIYGIISVCFKF